MAWNIAGMDRRTRDAAVEAARRAGMRLDDWLDEAITDYAGVGDHAQSNPTRRKTLASRQPPDVSNGLPEDMRPQKTQARAEFRTLSITRSGALKRGSPAPKPRRLGPLKLSPKFWSGMTRPETVNAAL